MNTDIVIDNSISTKKRCMNRLYLRVSNQRGMRPSFPKVLKEIFFPFVFCEGKDPFLVL